MSSANGIVITMTYLRAAGLHFHLSAFFDSPESKDYHAHLYALWQSTISFLECINDLETAAGSYLLPHATNYILQMIIAAGFALLKLLNSSFAAVIKLSYGRELFTKAIKAIRTISVATNDLPSRLAEVLAQLWKSGGSGMKTHGEGSGEQNSLQLKVRCRMSMSHLYDSVWRWREEFQAKGRGNLESTLPCRQSDLEADVKNLGAVKNPTNPDSNVESSASSTVDLGLPSAGMTGGMITPGPSNMFGEANYEVFDPLGWMLDGYVNFPFDINDGNGIG